MISLLFFPTFTIQPSADANPDAPWDTHLLETQNPADSNAITVVRTLTQRSINLLSVGYLRSALATFCKSTITPSDIGAIVARYVSSGSIFVRFHSNHSQKLQKNQSKVAKAELKLAQLRRSIMAQYAPRAPINSTTVGADSSDSSDSNASKVTRTISEKNRLNLITSLQSLRQRLVAAEEDIRIDQEGHRRTEMVFVKLDEMAKCLRATLVETDCACDDYKARNNMNFGVLWVGKDKIQKFEALVVDPGSDLMVNYKFASARAANCLVPKFSLLLDHCNDKHQLNVFSKYMQLSDLVIEDSKTKMSDSLCELRSGDYFEVKIEKELSDRRMQCFSNSIESATLYKNGKEVKQAMKVFGEANASNQKFVEYGVLECVSCNCTDRKGFQFRIQV